MELPKISSTANQQKKTFTLRLKYKDNRTSKYRVWTDSSEEFERMENYTEGDWRWFLRSSENYTEVN